MTKSFLVITYIICHKTDEILLAKVGFAEEELQRGPSLHSKCRRNEERESHHCCAFTKCTDVFTAINKSDSDILHIASKRFKKDCND